MASLASADCSPFSIHYGKPTYEVNESSYLHVTGTPGDFYVILFDPIPGPVFIPGLATFGVGLSSSLYIEFPPFMSPSGYAKFGCHFDCDAPILDIPLYTQVASIDPATLTICVSNVAVLTVVDSTGACSPHGCTPGYWKNHTDNWGASGYAPGDDFDTVFGVNYFDPDVTLLEALDAGTSPSPNLPMHAVAALLNASSAGVLNYPYSKQEVLDQVAAALTGGDFASIRALKDSLDAANNAGCPF